MSGTASRRHLDGSTGNRVTFLVGIGLVVALGAVVLQVACKQGVAPPPAIIKSVPGDEPPIRVKGGSIDMEIDGVEDLTNGAWDGSGKSWKVLHGTRKGDDLGYAILGSPGACPAVGHDVQKLTFGFATDQNDVNPKDDVTIQSMGSKTVVKSKQDMAVDTTNRRILSYPGRSDYWSMTVHLRGGGQPVTCTFGKGDEVVVFEW